MVWLGLLYSILTVVVPFGLLTSGRSAIAYRTTGVERSRALRGGLLLLGLSAIWSLLGAMLWLTGTSWPPPPPRLADVLFQVLPLLCGWLPAVLVVVLALPPSHAPLDRIPSWALWFDTFWRS